MDINEHGFVEKQPDNWTGLHRGHTVRVTCHWASPEGPLLWKVDVRHPTGALELVRNEPIQSHDIARCLEAGWNEAVARVDRHVTGK